MASERMTSASLPGFFGAGWADYGRIEPAEIIRQARLHAQHMKDQAEAILSASDHEFRVETYIGIHVRKQLEVLQPGRQPLPAPPARGGE